MPPTDLEITAGIKVFDRVVLLNDSIASDMLFDVEIETLVAAILVAAEIAREDEAMAISRRCRKRLKK